MANPIERIKRFTNKIATTHFPHLENDDYSINNSLKVNAIKECLDELNLEYIVDDRYGIIVSNGFNKELKDVKNNKAIKEKLKDIDLIIVSHIDMISKFNKQDVLDKFKNDIQELNNYEDIISGPLDNTITNAVLLALLALRVENFNDDCKDVMAIFSIGEEQFSERGFKEDSGIENFMDKFVSRLKEDVRFINLDVTASEYHEYEYDKDVAAFIEYDESLYAHKVDKSDQYSRLNIFDENDICSNINFRDYDEDGTCDDLEDITSYEDTFGLSFCLNTYGTIHSKKNSTSVANIDSYFNQLNHFFESNLFRPKLKK